MPGRRMPGRRMPGSLGYLWAVAALLVGRFGLTGANIASVALVARVLPKAEFGVYVLVTGMVLLLAQVADFGTGPVFGQFAGRIDAAMIDPKLSGAVWGSFLLVRAVLAIAATLCGIGGALIAGSGPMTPFMLASVACGFAAARFFDPLYQVAGRAWRSAATQGVGAAAILGASLLAAALRPTLIGFVAAFAAAQILFAAASFMAARDLIEAPMRVEPELVWRMVRLAAPIGLAGLMTAFNGRGNLLFLAHYSGDAALARYGAANRVLDLAVNFAVVVLWPLIPQFSRAAQAGTDELAAAIRKAIGLALHLVLPLLVVAPVGAPWLMWLLYGARYEDAAPVLAVLALVGAGVVFSLLASYALMALQVTHYAIRITMLSAMFSLACNAVLVPALGAMGAAISAAGTEAVLVSLVTQALLRHVPGAIAWRGMLRALALAAGGELVLQAALPHVGPAVCLVALIPAGVTLYGLLRNRGLGPA